MSVGDYQDNMLRAQVADAAFMALAHHETVPTPELIRKQLGGGDTERIRIHLSDWLRRISHILRQAADDQYVFLERDEMSQALQHVREVKNAAANFAATMHSVFSEQLDELRTQIGTLSTEATGFVAS